MPKKIIAKPVYWTDFEDLCKRLWSEIWQLPETKKHGRTGQPQYGVDIYGRPAGGGYVGIQCKGKDDYSHKQLTVIEIKAEVEKAKHFQPKLSKFYLATTSNRSSATDKFVRRLDEEHRELGLFEVHVFYWEDIADLIEENRHTHDWYVPNQGFRQHTEAGLTFENGQTEMTLRPRFVEEETRYLNVELLKMVDHRESIRKLKEMAGPFETKIRKIETFEDYVDFLNSDTPDDYNTTTDPQPVEHFFRQFALEASRKNHSVCTVRLKLSNTGNTVLENFKVYLTFKNVITCDTVNKNTKMLDLTRYEYNTKFLSSEPLKAEYKPVETVLVQHDGLFLDRLCFRTAPTPVNVVIEWKLVARGYQNSGQLTIDVKPVIEKNEHAKWVSEPGSFNPKSVIRNSYKY